MLSVDVLTLASWLGIVVISAFSSAALAESSQGNAPITTPPLPNPIPSPEAPSQPEPDAVRSQVLNALTNSATRYPAFVYPGGQYKFGHTTAFDIRQNAQQWIGQRLSHQYFPSDRQLYWVLPGNRIVIETEGWQGELSYQGRETDTTVRQTVEVSQALWGFQASWILPQSWQELVGREATPASLLSVAAEATNLPGLPAPPIVIETKRLFTQPIQPPRIGTGSTFNPSGGGDLFNQLEVENAPKILQAFPTVNLQALLSGEGLFEGAKLSKGALSQAGIEFGNPLTGEGYQFNPAVTSIPGIKIAQRTQFDNPDLLNLLVNPYLDPGDRDLHYLNSLNWVSLGLRTPKILSTTVADAGQNWYGLRVTRSHNRTLLQYEKASDQATYYNIFSNPGVAVSMLLDRRAVDGTQSANATIGLLLGAAFDWVRSHRIEKSVWEARLRYGREEAFTPLRTQTAPEQRRQINQRLDQTLSQAHRGSGLAQLSGSFTFPSRITPTRSSVVQIRAGNVARRIRFNQIDQTWSETESYISKLRISNRTFGPLTWIGSAIPRSQTSLAEQTTAVKTFVTTTDGRTFEFNPANDLTVVPTQIRAFDAAFDRIDLTQRGEITTYVKGFEGILDLPSLEALWAGSRGSLNYSVAAGLWGNFNPKRLPGIDSEAIPEPRLGLYTKASLSWLRRRSQTVQIPAIQFAWNSATNASNPAYLTFSYSYLHQTPHNNLALTAGALLSYGDRKLSPLVFTRAQWGSGSGLNLTTTLELGDYFLGGLEAQQALSPAWSLGLYGQNYQTIAGLNTRSTGRAYGLLLQHRFSGDTTVQMRAGMNGDRFGIQLEGQVRF